MARFFGAMGSVTWLSAAMSAWLPDALFAAAGRHLRPRAPAQGPCARSCKGAIVRIDLITWGIWGFGLALLTYWCVNTCREFIHLFTRHKQPKKREP